MMEITFNKPGLFTFIRSLIPGDHRWSGLERVIECAVHGVLSFFPA